MPNSISLPKFLRKLKDEDLYTYFFPFLKELMGNGLLDEFLHDASNKQIRCPIWRDCDTIIDGFKLVKIQNKSPYTILDIVSWCNCAKGEIWSKIFSNHACKNRCLDYF